MKLVEFETHCHTKETSICSKISAGDIIRAYAEKGYNAVFITDHFYAKFFDRPDLKRLDWKDKADKYLAGYRAAKKTGRECGVNVLLGMEVQPADAPYDFLVFGMEEGDVYDMEDAYRLEMPEMYEYMHEKGYLVFQAHPYRYGLQPAAPEHYDGIEIFNAHPRHNSRNKHALNFAYEHDLLTIAGSDVHRLEDVGRSGVMMPEDIRTEKDFVHYYRTVGSPELIIICD